MSRGYRDAYSVDSRSSAYGAGRPDFFTSPPEVFPEADLRDMTRQQRRELLRTILERKVHGLAFSPYLDGQKPGLDVSEDQIRQRMSLIAPYTSWVRMFSCTEGNEAAPRIAHELGLKTMVGIDLGRDDAENKAELEAGIELARAGHVDILAVGNEVLLRGDMADHDLAGCIDMVRDAVPSVTVGYVDAYFLFENHPRVTEACEVLLINCYPFWEYCPHEYALHHMQEMHRRIQNIANGKPIVISETGWPSAGSPYGGAVPSMDNALDYFINTYLWADKEGIDVVYFAAFDEAWKTGDEGDVGSSWGVWDTKGELKFR